MDVQMTLFEHIAGFDFSVFDAYVGLAEYKHSVRNLNWDIEYTERRRPEIARVMIHYEREVGDRKRAPRSRERRSSGETQARSFLIAANRRDTSFTHSTASRTSCTRRMEAPFISAMVFKTVVPFSASSGRGAQHRVDHPLAG